MTKLHNISKDYLGFLESDLDAEQLNECLSSIEDAFEDKANNILALVNTLDSDTSAIDAEIKRLQERKKAINSNKDRLKEYLRYNMEQTGINKISCPLFTVTLGKPTKKVEVVDLDLIPDEYVTIKSEVKPNLTELKKAMKENDVPGAVMVEGKSRLLIK